MKLSSLAIKQLEFPYTIPAKKLEGVTQDAEFFIDGESLAERFNISKARPWFGRTGFLGSEASISHFAKELLGDVKADNQFGSKRVVLYRCHCGSDYCGVISCQVVKESSVIHWLDIWEESDEDDAEMHSSVNIDRISFDFEQYQEAITAFLATQSVNE